MTKIESALLTMTRTQLNALLLHVPGASVPVMSRATDEALFSAVLTYVKLGRLTEDQILKAAASGGRTPPCV